MSDYILIDGSSYLFRAFHAMPPLTNKEGQPTGATRGVISMIRSMQQDYPDANLVVVFDAKGPTFRNELYDQYKANRPPMPDELRLQIDDIHRIIRAMGLPLLSVSGVEADDVIGTLAKQLSQEQHQVLISTGDKDMAQLINERVTLLNTMNQKRLDASSMQEKYGFGPELMIDYLALMGDKVDNIPGVPGVGEKTATALLQALGGIDSIYQQLDAVAELPIRGAKSLAKKLQEHQDQARLSYRLATISCDLDLQLQSDALNSQAPDQALLHELFARLEFRSWLKELDGQQGSALTSGSTAASASHDPAMDVIQPSPAPTELDYQSLDSLEQLTSYLQEAKSKGRLALHAHCRSQHYLQQQVIALSLSHGPGSARVLQLVANGMPQGIEAQELMALIAPYLADFQLEKIVLDLKAWLHLLSQYDIRPHRMKDDVSLMANALNSSLPRAGELSKHYDPYHLDNLSRQHLDLDSLLLEEIAGQFGKKQLCLSELDSSHCLTYLAQRADLCFRLFEHLRAELQQQPELLAVYRQIEAPLVPSLVAMERRGVTLDRQQLSTLSATFSEQAEQLMQQAFELAGEEFNLDSPKQLADVLFGKLGLPAGKKTAKGQASTNEEVLNELALSYPLPAIILQYRRLKKLLGTYTLPLAELIQASTGRVHTSYHQTGASTGRFSSSEPNLQNIPIRHPEGRLIRQAFVPQAGWLMLAADYSQIELRIMAHLSQDEGLIRAFAAGEDIHKATAADTMQLNLDQVTPEMRRNAKAINFGLIYGMSAFGLAKQLGIERKEASDYVNRYFQRYPGVKDYMERTREQAKQQGYVQTLYGRRLYLPGLASSNAMVRAGAERTAINAPMQGTAADIIKKAMVDVYQWCKDRDDIGLLLQVHDELVFEVRSEQLAELQQGIRLRMQQAASLSVPLVVDLGVGDNWDQAH